MKVFISWSGNKSHKVALIFREWLPSVIQSLEPYVSSEDIDKGARWSSDIAKELEDSSFGILCVTKDNLHAPWLAFEAGALSKTMDKSYVTPFLFDIKRSEVNGPILQFQSTIFEKDDIKKLVHTLNKACGEDGITDVMLDKAFEVWYPTLENELNVIKQDDEYISEEVNKEENGSIEIIEEILELSRDNQKLLRNPDNKIYESIEGLKERIDVTLTKFERSTYIGERRLFRKNRSMVIDEFVHTVLNECQKQYAFLIVLSVVQGEFPWIYNLGKELLDVLASRKSNVVKKETISNFVKIVEISFEHPTIRDTYLNRKEEYMTVHDIKYIILELVEALSYEISF